MIAYLQRLNLDASHAGERGTTNSPVIECEAGGEIRPRVGRFWVKCFQPGNVQDLVTMVEGVVGFG